MITNSDPKGFLLSRIGNYKQWSKGIEFYSTGQVVTNSDPKGQSLPSRTSDYSDPKGWSITQQDE